jgi:hypothetical protein
MKKFNYRRARERIMFLNSVIVMAFWIIKLVSVAFNYRINPYAGEMDTQVRS